MAKYINADEIDYMYASIGGQPEELMSFKAWIDEMPSADVVEVVRCKDCKYFEVDTYITQNNYLECGDCNFHTVCLRKWGDDFCSRGERRKIECR